MSLLNKELTLKIRPLVLKGVNYTDIQKELSIADGTWDYWVWNNSKIKKDGQGFRDFLNNTKHERMLRKAEDISDEITSLQAVDSNGKTDAQLLKLKHDESKFLRTTLGKIDYSTRTENDVTSNGETVNFVLNAELNERDDISQNTKNSGIE